MVIPINRTGEHSLNVAGADIFFKMKKCIAAHGEMLMKFIIKIELSWFDLRMEEL